MSHPSKGTGSSVPNIFSVNIKLTESLADKDFRFTTLNKIVELGHSNTNSRMEKIENRLDKMEQTNSNMEKILLQLQKTLCSQTPSDNNQKESKEVEKPPKVQRSGNQSGSNSRPTTAQNVEGASSSDLQGIYEVSNPPTPRTVPARPQLFTQSNYPASAQSPVASVSRIEARQMYEITREISQPIFTIVDIDRSFAGKVLGGYIARGSSITGVDVNLLDVSLTSLPACGQKVDVVWLSEHGMPLFDAITWIRADKSIRPPLKLKANAKEFRPAPQGVIAKALFFCYFYLLTQAHYPSTLGAGQNVPSFLKNVAGLREPPEYYVRLLCSFNPVLFDARWIRDVKFKSFGQEVMSRFGLGISGYRMFAPFKLYAPRPDLDERARPAFQYARAVAQSRPTWTVHPITRLPSLLSERGNLNKNLSNLMRYCYTSETLNEMVTAKLLYAMPIAQPGHNNWMFWSAEIGIAAEDPIF
ncbi:hypothetical protein HI914_03349 [Erysiphe necator]|nr:hypothetical protein HI914_03349 [Erysiphe necator]